MLIPSLQPGREGGRDTKTLPEVLVISPVGRSAFNQQRSRNLFIRLPQKSDGLTTVAEVSPVYVLSQWS